MKIYTRILILSFSLIAISCSKDKSSKWITGEFNIIDSETKEPVQASLKLRYYEGSIFGSSETAEEIGSTDENGYFKLQKNINKRNQQYTLEVFVKGWYGSYGYFAEFGYPDVTQELSKNGKNEFTIEIPPVYAYELTLNNTSCFDETDSLWVIKDGYPANPLVYTGCVDNYTTPTDNWTNTTTSRLTTISKKNGIYDTIIHPLTLIQGDENAVIINY